MVTIPAFALHHMEEYYPDPENFDPERLVPLPKGMAWNVEVNRSCWTFKVESQE